MTLQTQQTSIQSTDKSINEYKNKQNREHSKQRTMQIWKDAGDGISLSLPFDTNIPHGISYTQNLSQW